MRCIYETTVIGNTVRLVDRCERFGAPSITNRVEEVVQELIARGIDTRGSWIVYLDTAANWDGIIIDAETGGFSQFFISQEATCEEALRAMYERSLIPGIWRSDWARPLQAPASTVPTEKVAA